MEIILSGVGFKTNGALRAYAKQRILSWLGHLQREIEVITVQVERQSDEEGRPTQCRLLVRPVDGDSLVVEESSTDVYEAIDSAPERMAKALELSMHKQRRPAPAGV